MTEEQLNRENEFKVYLDSIDKYALNDLEKMLECADYTSHYKRLAVPIAQLCFSLLDIIGFLFFDFEAAKRKKKEASDEEKITLSLDYIFKSQLDKDQKRCLVDVYRNGVVHYFFPKMAAICNRIEDQSIITICNGYINLNVNPFAKTIVYQFRNELKMRLLEKPYILDNFAHYIDKIKKPSGYYTVIITETTTTSSTSTTTNPWYGN